MVNVKYNETIWEFRDEISFKEYDKIKRSFPKPFEPKTADWWKEWTEYGEYFLNRLLLEEQQESFFVEAKDWEIFLPVLENFFIETEMYQRIVKNVAFLRGRSKDFIEDKGFIKYILMRKYGFMDFEQIDHANYKDIMNFYYYEILQDMFKNFGTKEPEPSGDMFK